MEIKTMNSLVSLYWYNEGELSQASPGCEEVTVSTHQGKQKFCGLLQGNFKSLQGIWVVRVFNFIGQTWAGLTLFSPPLLTHLPDNISILY